ncbi:EAL domain-containing protein [Ureibacillus aquaedulcis]|uniref:EAL domain-containing protein n=1 Tax=Ureibacillus aquaedulcis TaxID=3058421 RepID=A0ABT8GSD6_9BACL|nr:EAL domain-containing protein [Ureibacillus sp. BA0131]MDN4494330.1 EAL domain-containing protein [Ureibacillus sp. BA0131]
MNLPKIDFSQNIIESQKHCERIGMDPDKFPATRYCSDADLQKKLLEFAKLFDVLDFFADQLFQMVQGIPFLLIVTDEEGTLLDIKGDDKLNQNFEKLGARIGIECTEEDYGTNSISLALTSNQPTQVVGMQHYKTFFHGIACYTVPLTFESDGKRKGTMTIITLLEFQSPLLLTMLYSVVNAIEREIQLKDSNTRLNILNQVVIESSKNGIVEIDKTGTITAINEIGQSYTGWERNSVIDEESYFGAYLKQVLQGKDFSNIEIKFLDRKTGNQVIALFDGIPLYNPNGELTGAFAQLKDITERHKTKEQIRYLAYHDELTGLPNRRSFNGTLEEKLGLVKENGGTLSIFLLDLDRFKFINDTLGHEKGDWLLTEVTKRLHDSLPDNAELYRMGGDEFTIILTDYTDLREVTSFAEKILELFKRSFVIDEYEFHISTSIGIAIHQDCNPEAGSLFRRADTAMYRAKEKGKNNYVLYDSEIGHRYFEKLTFEQDLRHAIQLNHLELYYQPQVSLCSQMIIGLEALVRWNHPKLGLILPGDIIPLAEEMGMATLLGDFVLQQACQQLSSWKARGLPLVKIAVNLSPQDFLSHSIVEKVHQALTQSNIEPHYLEIEITESMAMDVKHAISVMEELNQLGVQIAMDDFGKGYSSLNYLKNFPIHRLKIDRSFIHELMVDQNDAKIINAIIHLAHILNLEVIAEGVETKEQAAFLYDLKCNEAQGYYFGKPMPLYDIEELLFGNKRI